MPPLQFPRQSRIRRRLVRGLDIEDLPVGTHDTLARDETGWVPPKAIDCSFEEVSRRYGLLLRVPG